MREFPVEEFPTWLATENRTGVKPEQSLGDWISERLGVVAGGAKVDVVVRGIGESLLGGHMECVRRGRADKVAEFMQQVRDLSDEQKLVCVNGVGSAGARSVKYYSEPIDPVALREHDMHVSGLMGAILGSMGGRRE